MDNEVENALDNLKFAKLTEKQEQELRKIEKQFNTEFGSAFYFMAFDRTNHTSNS